METIKDELVGVKEIKDYQVFATIPYPDQYRMRDRDIVKGPKAQAKIGDKVCFNRMVVRVGYLFGAHLFDDAEIYEMSRDIMIQDTGISREMLVRLENKYRGFYNCIRHRAVRALIDQYRNKYLALHRDEDKDLLRWRIYGRSLWFVDVPKIKSEPLQATVIGTTGRWTGLYEAGRVWDDDYDPPVLYNQQYQHLLVVNHWTVSGSSGSLVYPADVIG